MSARRPILIGESGAAVFRVQRDDGAEWIEKSGPVEEIAAEVARLAWCPRALPIALLLAHEPGLITMSALPSVDLTSLPTENVVTMLADALTLLHAVPIEDCPFDAGWDVRLQEAARRVHDGLVDESDFDDDNLGRTAMEVLAELQTLSPPTPEVRRFTHGDACLPNFLSDGAQLTGIVDIGRSGVAHPAQDWALALRSLHDNRGVEAARLLEPHLPPHCRDASLLRQFRLLDELF